MLFTTHNPMLGLVTEVSEASAYSSQPKNNIAPHIFAIKYWKYIAVKPTVISADGLEFIHITSWTTCGHS